MIYRAFYKLVLQRIDAERAHRLAATVLAGLARVPGLLGLLDRLLGVAQEGLAANLGELTVRSPLGVAAGVDKNATWFEPLAALGFGFVEIGTATARAQAGNKDRPRVSRLPRDGALINAMGFPNEGAEAIASRLATRRGHEVVGINIGKSKAVDLDHAVADYRESVRVLAPHADYLALNVSSPNTPELRQLQSAERLTALVAGVREELKAQGRGEPPLMVKLAPDLPDAEVAELAELALRLGLGGLIAVNTTIDAALAPASAAEIAAQGHGGGISGRPLQARALEILHILRERTEGQVPLVSVGGVETPAEAWERILAGASLVQAYTAFVYGGPLWPYRMNRGLGRLLGESEWSSIAEAVGKGATAPR